jgi:acylphosphatase
MPGLSRARVRRHVWVAGRVQGVFFRGTCEQVARARGVDGWVRNLPDLRVEAVFEGPPEAVDALVAWCRSGPPGARVDRVEVVVEEPVGETGFEVR